jgi:translation initiation factor IF-1
MVKNTKGGKNAKKFGRKFATQGGGPSVLRMSKDPAEIYACCSKIYGGANIEVKCVDGNDRLCIMRNKFRGRGKRDNVISVGTWLLVGLREFETVKEGKRENCDLLEVYKDYDKEKLQQNEPNISWSILKSVRSATESYVNDKDENDLFEFSDNKAEDIEEMINNSSTTMIQAEDQESDIDIDDI